MLYLWLKSFHLIFMVCWFAGLFYLPRLFVYHTQCTDQISDQRFSIMERRLYYGIMTPSAVLTLIFGIALICLNPKYYLMASWFHLKLLLVFLLIAYHGACGYLKSQFTHRQNKYSRAFYRWFNEFPVLLLIGIVLLVILKPF